MQETKYTDKEVPMYFDITVNDAYTYNEKELNYFLNKSNLTMGEAQLLVRNFIAAVDSAKNLNEKRHIIAKTCVETRESFDNPYSARIGFMQLALETIRRKDGRF